MTAKPLFGLRKPRLEYSRLGGRTVIPEFIRPAGRAVLLHAAPEKPRSASGLKIGDTVRTGQKIALYGESGGYVVASVTGKIASIANRPGDYGRSFTAVTVAVDGAEARDDSFAQAAGEPSLENAQAFLAALPGLPPFARMANAERPLKTLVVCGVDQDLLVLTQQYALQARLADIRRGIEILKKIAGFEEAVILSPKESVQGYGHIGARFAGVSLRYPAARPALVMAEVFDRIVPAGQTPEDLGFCFITAEAAASVGAAYANAAVPVNKLLTVITKEGASRLAETPIGTPVGDILERYKVTVAAGDRIVLGGPMRGSAAYALDHPVQPDTDAVMVLDAARAARSTDYPCINCGECVRVCPARIPVNMLICYLAAGKYQDAVDACDLFSCVECGLCSYVCVSMIPIFQYITLAKYELARMRTLEAMNA